MLRNHFSSEAMTFKLMQWDLTCNYPYAENDPIYWNIITKHKDFFSEVLYF